MGFLPHMLGQSTLPSATSLCGKSDNNAQGEIAEKSRRTPDRGFSRFGALPYWQPDRLGRIIQDSRGKWWRIIPNACAIEMRCSKEMGWREERPSPATRTGTTKRYYGKRRLSATITIRGSRRYAAASAASSMGQMALTSGRDGARPARVERKALTTDDAQDAS